MFLLGFYTGVACSGFLIGLYGEMMDGSGDMEVPCYLFGFGRGLGVGVVPEAAMTVIRGG